nr:actin-capping protein Z alpha chain - chicken (fragments) [Gallus gallus]
DIQDSVQVSSSIVEAENEYQTAISQNYQTM